MRSESGGTRSLSRCRWCLGVATIGVIGMCLVASGAREQEIRKQEFVAALQERRVSLVRESDKCGWLRAVSPRCAEIVEPWLSTRVKVSYYSRYLMCFSFPQVDFTDQDLSVVSQWREITELWLSNAQVTDAGVAALARLPRLRELSLGCGKVGDAGMREISRISALRSLSVVGSGLTDAGMPSLSRLTNLEELNVALTEVSDQGLACLEKLPRLTELCLCGTNITDEGLASVAACRRLKRVDVSDTMVTAEGVEKLQRLRPDLAIEGEMLADPRHPMILDWPDGEMTDEAILPLSKTRQLVELSVCRGNVSDDALILLAKCRSLKKLNVSGTKVTAEGVSRLRRLRPEMEIKADHLGDALSASGEE